MIINVIVCKKIDKRPYNNNIVIIQLLLIDIRVGTYRRSRVYYLCRQSEICSLVRGPSSPQ